MTTLITLLTPPALTALSESPSSGDLGVGQSVTIALTTSEAVTVTGTPTLILNDGGTATYDAANSTSTSLVFDYTVAAGQNTPSLAALAATGVNSFVSGGMNDKLVTAASTLDLSHTTVGGFTVASTNAQGTTFTVGDLGTALQIVGGPGHDTLIAPGFTVTADQRTEIFNTGSIEIITDPSGTFAAPPPSPGIVGLTTGNDTFVAPPSGSTVFATAATLNAGDSLTGGTDTDVLALVGSGRFGVDQLAVFTGFESIRLDNVTNSFVNLILGGQPVEVDATGPLGIQINSPSNWNGSDIVNANSSQASPTTYFPKNPLEDPIETDSTESGSVPFTPSCPDPNRIASFGLAVPASLTTTQMLSQKGMLESAGGNDPLAAAGAGSATLLTLNGSQATGFYFSGNQDIDATLIGSRWTFLNQTYSFPTNGTFYVGYATDEAKHFTSFNAAQQQAVHRSLALVSSYTNLTFTEITETATTHATHRFGQTSIVKSAEGHFPANTSDAGDIWLNDSVSGSPQPFYLTPAIGNWGQATIMHEIGHTLGLKHGHQDYTFVDLSADLHVAGTRYGTKALPANHDGQAWSLMTYQGDPSDVPNTFNGDQFNQPETYMQDDIAALQYLYGANFNFNSTNTTYTWSPTTGQEFINGLGQGLPQGNKIFETIWDGNGIDTYDLSNYTVSVIINLNPGQFSTFSSSQLADTESRSHPGLHFAPGNVANALLYNGDLRSLIENANGGFNGDTIIGNVADNTLRGEGGNDTIDGGAGTDRAAFSGQRSAYTLTALGGNGERVSGPDGTDTLTNVELLVFDDQIVTLTPGGATDDFKDSLADTGVFGSVVVGGSSTGTLEVINDHDWFSVQFTAGMSYVIDLQGAQTGGGTLEDPYLRVYNSAGVFQTENDDIILGVNRDSHLTFTPSTTGTYYLDAGAYDDPTHHYTGTYRISVAGTGPTDDFKDSLADTGVFGSVAVNGSSIGNLEITGDRDWFSINLIAGTSYVINLQGLAGGGTLEDPYLRLHDSSGVLLTQNDDIVYPTNLDSRLTFSATTTGIYYIEAGAFADNYTGTYRVSVNQTILIDDYANSLTDSTHPFGSVVANGSNTGNLEITGDRDWFSINLIAGTSYVINLQGLQAGGGTLEDPYLRVHNSAGTLLVENDDIVLGVNRDSQLTFAATTTGTYYLEAAAFADDYTGTYRVSVTPSSPFTEGPDTVTLTQPGGTWHALGGDDRVTGTSGADVIYGEAGNDTLNGGAGADKLFGGTGDDIYVVDNAGDVVDETGGDGIDTVQSSVTFSLADAAHAKGEIENLTLTGSSAINGTGNALANVITGNSSKNVLAGGANGVAGDTVSYEHATAGVKVSLATASAQNTVGAGTDTLTGFENLIGSGFNDKLTGNGSANVLTGGAGNDTLNGGGAADALFGGIGDDILIGGAGGDTLDGGNDIDTTSYAGSTLGVTVDLRLAGLQVSAGDASGDVLISIDNLIGSALADRLTGDGNDNVLTGGAGNDNLAGGGNGAAGDTASYATATAGVTVSLVIQNGVTAQNTVGAGTDTLSEFENLIGSAFNDRLTGDAGNNTLTGLAGNDTLIGGLGDDTLDGGVGTADMASYAPASSGVTVRLVTAGPQNTLGAGIDTLVGIENLIGSAFNDTLAGDGLANRIDGGAGDDTIEGGAGNGVLLGRLNGAAGDTVSYEHATAGVKVSLATASAQNTVGAGTDTLSGFENLTGSAFNDKLTGNGFANVLAGGAGDDTLNGGAGNDTLTGGIGADTFAFSSGFGKDTITDFDTSQDSQDVIQFNPALFANYSLAMGHTQQVGTDTVITFNANNTVTLANVIASSLGPTNFKFA